MKPRVALNDINDVGECPLWDDRTGTLWWVDLTEGRVVQGSDAQQAQQWFKFHSTVGAIALTQDERIVAVVGATVLALHPDGWTQHVADLPVPKGHRANDAQVDPSGRLIVGTLNPDAPAGQGQVWAVDGDGRVADLLRDLDFPNGIGWAPDGREFYVADSLARTIYRASYDLSTGTCGVLEVLVRLQPADGLPDGLTVDRNGDLWIACWDGAAVRHFSCGGTLKSVIDIPAPRVTSCCFGGDELSTLFVTSGLYELTESQLKRYPDSGAIFAVDEVGMGIATRRFDCRP